MANRLSKAWRTNGTEATADDTLLLGIGYDALNRRVESIEYIDPATGDPLATPQRTWHVYSGLEVVEEYSATSDGQGGYSTTLLREFVHGSGSGHPLGASPPGGIPGADGPAYPRPVVLVDHTDAGSIPATGQPGGGPEVFHYLADVLGSVVGLTDAGDPNPAPPAQPVPPKLVERYTYDPYGATYIEVPNGQGGWTFTDPVTSQTYARSTLGNPFMWTGQRFDPTTRLYHFWARSYSPRLGRWLQRDPLGYVDGVNHYEYCMGNPTAFVDALGFGIGSSIFGEAGWAGIKEFFASLGRDAADTAGDVVGGACAIATSGEAREAAGEEFDKIIDANAQRILGKTRTDETELIGEIELAGAVIKDLVGTDLLAEGIYGVDLATGEELTDTEAQQRVLTAISAFAGLAAWTKANLETSDVRPQADVRYGPHTEGPLPEGVANTFRGGSYTQTTLQSETTFYRVYGGEAGELGSYWTRTPPQGPLQARMDLALNPRWGNTAENVVRIRVPRGTTVYDGSAGRQGNLLGGGSQVYVPKVDPAWAVTP